MRKLRAEEIECRVATVSEKGCSLLLYKDARVDMKILDSEFGGPMNWQRKHESIDGKMFCTISVWDDERKHWVSKQDVGVESYTEATKGESSDSFKRAGFCWGIGRELYTAPFIWINKNDCNLVDKNGKKTTYDHFTVRDIQYDGDKISALEIFNDSLKRTVYTYGKLTASTPKIAEEPKEEKKYTPNLIPKADDRDKKATIGQLAQLESICKENDVPASYVAQAYKTDDINNLTRVQVYSAINNFDMIKNKYFEEIPFK